jgi:spermidine synthase
VVVLPGEHNFFLTSGVPLETNSFTLTERLTERDIKTRWVTPAYLRYIFTTDRFAGVRQELEATKDVRLNHDLTPICYYYDLALWLSRFYPNLRGIFESVGLVNLWWVAVPLVIILMLVRWRRELAVVTTIAGIGLAEMTLQVVILFAFQVLHGYLYAEISLIVTAFMAGLALGSSGSNQLLTRCSSSSNKRTKKILIAVQIAIIIYSGLFPLLISSPIRTPTLVFPLLALLAGFLTGMAFPLALALARGSPSQAAGTLYGSDLVGGCLGALIGAGLFIPVLGIPQTCAAIVLVGVAGLLALVK